MLWLLPVWCLSAGTIENSTEKSISKNPLAIFHSMWEDPAYNYCNTARTASYLTSLEKDVIFVLNLVRQYPAEFNKTVVAYWPEYMEEKALSKSWYYTSLVAELKEMQPVGILQPDSLAWISARCHAISSGKNGYIGHQRQTVNCEKQERFSGECCQYGYEDALEIVMSLLIDEGIKDLGHRKIFLSPSYIGIGVSYQPHKTYRYNTVIDFTRNK
jgi:uncharacterized protein YkwD